MAKYKYITSGQLAISPDEIRSPWLNETRKRKVEADYKMTLLEETETYRKLCGLRQMNKSAAVTVVLTAIAAALLLMFTFRMAGTFEINKKTRTLVKENSLTLSHLALSENKALGEKSDRNSAEIAAANQMRKYTSEDVITVSTEGSEFIRVYYVVEDEAETGELSLKEKIENFLGLIRTEKE